MKINNNLFHFYFNLLQNLACTIKRKNNLFLVVLLLCTLTTKAQLQEKEYNSYSPQAPTTLSNLSNLSDGITVKDAEASTTDKKDQEVYSYLELSIDNQIGPFEWYEVRAIFEITPILSNGTFDTTFNKELVVSYNPLGEGAGTNFSDLSYLKIPNIYGFKVKVKPENIKVTKVSNGSTMALPTNNVQVKMGVKAKRYYTRAFPNLNLAYTIADNEITFSWTPNPAILEYELEWTWVDGYKEFDMNTILPASEISFSKRDFELNNTRIITTDKNFEIPMVYAKGYIIYRVRGIGRHSESPDVKSFGPWSSDGITLNKVSDWPNIITISQDHEKGINWQFQASYAEEGKKKEVVSYFDGSLRNRQTVTKINTDNSTIVGEVIYDTQGRAAIEVLPVPTSTDKIKFFNKFNKNTFNQAFSSLDFDYENPNSTLNCSFSSVGMANNSGASQYYSTNNSFLSSVNSNYIPDAKLFPYSQIEYTPDNTGRIARKGGVGPDHQLGKNHEMQYLYASVKDSKELNRLFGYSVGDYFRYKKNTVVDPNGQLSVSYIDPQGRTIATALAGSLPSGNNLVALEEENANIPANDHKMVKANLLNGNNTNVLGTTSNFPNQQDKRTFEEPIVVSGINVGHKFTYGFKQDKTFSFDKSCPVSYPFKYDLKLSFIDQCGKSFPEFPSIGQNGIRISSFAEQSFPPSGTLALNTGTYNLQKELKVNKEALLEYADDYISKLSDKNSTCYVNPAGFGPNISLDICNFSCTDFEKIVGDSSTRNEKQVLYVVNAFKNHYNNNSFTGVLNDASKVVVFFANSDNDNNGTDAISQADVNALSVRFNREWEILMVEYRAMCVAGSVYAKSCSLNRTTLLNDLSKRGQYGQIDATIKDANNNEVPNPKYILSVFNDKNALFYKANSAPGTTTGNNWKRPLRPYLDDVGRISYIRLNGNSNTISSFLPKIDTNLSLSNLHSVTMSNGEIVYYAKPEQLLNVSDFIENWENSWAESLLEYHPEYHYLDYSMAVCSNEKSYRIKLKDTTGAIKEYDAKFSSDGYDEFLKNVDTYDLAEKNGLIPAQAQDGNKFIFDKDPYFMQLTASFEDNSVYQLRTGIMVGALTNNYTKDQENIMQMAYRAVGCSAVVQNCDLVGYTNKINALSDTKKNQLWNTYKALYISYKTQIKHIFINLYAYSKNQYNGCIEPGTTGYPVNVIGDFVTQKADVSAKFTALESTYNTQSLCASTSGGFYNQMIKRFVPSDNLYDSGLSPNDAAQELQDSADFEYYSQTGNCPLLFDLDMFLNGFFTDVAIRRPFANISALNVPFTENYVSNDILKGLFKSSNPPPAFPLTSLNMGTTSNGGSLNINFSSNSVNSCTTKISLPTGSTYNWSDYGSSWTIVRLNQFFYESHANGVFRFQCLAFVYNPNDGSTKQIVLKGETCVAIGECGVNSDGSVIGQVLDPNSGISDQGNGCNKKYKFKKAFVAFLNELKNRGTLNSSTAVNLNGYSSYKQTYLAEFFGENTSSDIQTTWKKSNEGYQLVNPQWSFTFDMNLPNTIANIEGMYIHPGENSFNLYVKINGKIEIYQGKFRNKFDFSCCTTTGLGSNPSGGNNGAVCNTTSERVYEDGLKSVLNKFFSDNASRLGNTEIIEGPKLISLNPQLENFIQNSSLENHFQCIKEKITGAPNPTFHGIYYKIIVDPISFTLLLSPTENISSKYHKIDFIFYSANEVKNINSLDIIGSSNSQLARINYTDINNQIKTVERLITHYTADLGFNEMFEENFCAYISSYCVRGGGKLLKLEQEAKVLQSNINCNNFCIPKTVSPQACDDAKKETFLRFLDLKPDTIDGFTFYYSDRIKGYTVDKDEFDDFCKRNFHYYSDSYMQYIRNMGIINATDFGFMTLSQFTATYLQHDTLTINIALTEYAAYYRTNGPNSLLWNEWVNTLFKSNHKDYCPPKSLITETPGMPDLADSCEEQIKNLNETFSAEQYATYLQDKRKEFIANYIKEAMQVEEKLDMDYFDQEYQYTLYYYDQAGNLTQTVPPQGVARIKNIETINQQIEDYKDNNSPLSANTTDNLSLQPGHLFKTQYRYNSLNQLVWQKTPDGGVTQFVYDDLGRIIASQNEKQKESKRFNENNPHERYQEISYTVYDALGRIVEAGQLKLNENTFQYYDLGGGKLVEYQGKLPPRIIKDFKEFNHRSQVTRTVYSEDPLVETNVLASSLFTTNFTTGYNPSLTNRNRVTGVFYFDIYNQEVPLDYDNAIFYNYDVHGNVKEMVTYFSPLKDANCISTIINEDTGQKNDCEAHLKRVVYDYDLISGNVKTVTFQPNKTDQFIHRYNYDADNRIINVETSPDGVIWETDAKYQYYPHGPLARVELGDKKVQGIDYAYTLQGWLKAVNGENISNPIYDIGKDGLLTGTTKTKDVFGYSLSYYKGDYKAIKNDAEDNAFLPLQYSRNESIAGNITNLYNGNIKQMTTALRESGDKLLAVQKNNYKYDQLNRIKEMTSRAINPTNSSHLDSYSSNYSYDRNGNLKTLNRWGHKKNGALEQMDKLVYDYNYESNVEGKFKNNQLTLVEDSSTTAADSFDNDLESQVKQLELAGIIYDLNNKEKHNYIYDPIGQLIEDRSEKIKIEWRVDGKVSKVINNKTNIIISFDYDGLGNRIAKSVTKNAKVNRTYYARDAQANVLAVYDEVSDVPTTAITDNLYLNSYIVNNTQLKKATIGIYVSSDNSISSVNPPSGDLHLIAGEKIILSNGFIAKAGSEFKAQIEEVKVDNNSVFTLKEHHLYGSSRLGIEDKSQVIYKYVIPPLAEKIKTFTVENTIANEKSFISLIGDKRYELSNHLGNVLSVISDKKLPVLSSPSILQYFNADVLSFSDYYPFGSLVPNRHGSSESYRYGFNGMEKDNEIKNGDGNSYDFGARMYDPRVGRFFKVDTKWQQFPEWSPYVYALNNPIRLVDTNGEGPGDPLHHEFLTTTVLNIYDAAKLKGASGRGALLIMAQASIESGYGQDAIKRGDYNLFGTMTCSTCSDYKVKNSHGRIRDFSNSGGYQSSIDDYFDKKLKKWSGVAVLIKDEDFTADDVNKAFYTGKYIEDKKTRNKTGHGSYNFDNVSEDEKINNNKYGEVLLSQMNSLKKRLTASIDYQVEKNKKTISGIIKEKEKNSSNDTNLIPTLLRVKSFDDMLIEKLENENKRLLEIKEDISK